jgi:hypothetical protein
VIANACVLIFADASADNGVAPVKAALAARCDGVTSEGMIAYSSHILFACVVGRRGDRGFAAVRLQLCPGGAFYESVPPTTATVESGVCVNAARGGRRRRFFARLAVFFVAGVVLTVLMCWLLAFFVDPAGAEVQAASGVERGCRWSVTVGVRSGAFWAESLREMGANWSSHQATGAPDTPTSGDMVTAWASATPDAQREWLALSYPRSVVPDRIRICESYNPGAVDRVTIFDADGQEHEVWRGQDPTMPGAAPGVFDIPLSTSITTSRVKIYIDSPRVRGWNEIDAVGLVDSDGQTLWASEADASSSYGQPPRG